MRGKGKKKRKAERKVKEPNSPKLGWCKTHTVDKVNVARVREGFSHYISNVVSPSSVNNFQVTILHLFTDVMVADIDVLDLEVAFR